MKRNECTSYGMGFVHVLQIVFIVLKLCKVIEWSWVWVLSPSWISTILYLIAVVIIILGTRH